METKVYKCMVAGSNSNGEPDFWPCKIKATEDQFENGEHYELAKDMAEEDNFEADIVYDEQDPGMDFIKIDWDDKDIPFFEMQTSMKMK